MITKSLDQGIHVQLERGKHNVMPTGDSTLA